MSQGWMHATHRPSGHTVNANTTHYYDINGQPLNPSSTEIYSEVRESYAVTFLYLYLETNTITANGTFRTRKNQANGACSVSITASTTGTFTDTSNSESLASGDQIGYQYVTGTSGTSSQIRKMGAVFTPVSGNNGYGIWCAGCTDAALVLTGDLNHGYIYR